MPLNPLDVARTLLRLYAASGPGEVTVHLSTGETVTLKLTDRQDTARPETECEADVILVLSEVGHRLTTDELLAEFARRGLIHGDSTVRMALARMVRDKLLVNDQKARPKGYGLPDW